MMHLDAYEHHVNRGIAVIVEDDDDIRNSLTTFLRQSAFTVHATSSGLGGVEAVRKHNPVIVTVDVSLPDFDGFEVVRRIRNHSHAYTIMVSDSADEADALMAFGAGADDFLTKPIRDRELRARIAAMLRRPRCPVIKHPAPGSQVRALSPVGPASRASQGTLSMVAANAGKSQISEGNNLKHKGLTVNADTHTVAVNGNAVELTRTQFKLLLILMENGRRVQSKEELVRRLRNDPLGSGSYVSPTEQRTMVVHLADLRRRLSDDPRSPTWLETVHGVGYRLAP